MVLFLTIGVTTVRVWADTIAVNLIKNHNEQHSKVVSGMRDEAERKLALKRHGEKKDRDRSR